MLICKVCGGNEFSKEAGLSYCVECQTQVEDWREEGLVFGCYVGHDIKSAGFSSKTFDDLKENRKEIVYTSWEALNCLLKMQVTEIEQIIGIQNNFRFTVINLWFRYLKNRGYAFMPRRRWPCVDTIACKRDFAAIASWKLNYKRAKKRTKSLSISTKGSLISVLSSQLVSEDCTSSTMTQDISSDVSSILFESSRCSSGDSLSDSVSKIEKSFAELPRAYRKIWSRPKTIAFLYLGLLFSNCQVEIADLLRWIRERDVTYLSIETALPVKIKIQKNETVLFGLLQDCPPVNTIMLYMREICSSCNIFTIPCPNLYLLAQRYRIELHLPDFMDEHLKTLVDKYPFCYTNRKLDKFFNYTSYECQAMSYVIVLLKIFFGLDGVSELSISTRAKKLNQENGLNQKIFVWQEWVDWIEFRNAFLASQYFWAKQKFDSGSPFNKAYASKNTPIGPIETKGVLTEVTKRTLAGFMTEFTDDVESPPKLLPSLHPFCNAVSAAIRDDNVKESIKEVLKQDFKNNTLYRPEEKLKKSLKRPLETYDEFVMLYNPKADVEVLLSHSESNNNIKCKLSDCIKKSNLCPSTKYWVVSYNDTHSLLFPELLNKLPPTFVWLLKQCQAIIDYPLKALYQEVYRLESKFVIPVADKNSLIHEIKGNLRGRLCISRKFGNII